MNSHFDLLARCKAVLRISHFFDLVQIVGLFPTEAKTESPRQEYTAWVMVEKL